MQWKKGILVQGLHPSGCVQQNPSYSRLIEKEMPGLIRGPGCANLPVTHCSLWHSQLTQCQCKAWGTEELGEVGAILSWGLIFCLPEHVNWAMDYAGLTHTILNDILNVPAVTGFAKWSSCVHAQVFPLGMTLEELCCPHPWDLPHPVEGICSANA